MALIVNNMLIQICLKYTKKRERYLRSLSGNGDGLNCEWNFIALWAVSHAQAEILALFCLALNSSSERASSLMLSSQLMSTVCFSLSVSEISLESCNSTHFEGVEVKNTIHLCCIINRSPLAGLTNMICFHLLGGSCPLKRHPLSFNQDLANRLLRMKNEENRSILIRSKNLLLFHLH